MPPARPPLPPCSPRPFSKPPPPASSWLVGAGTNCSAPPRCTRPTRCLMPWSTAGCSTRPWPAGSGPRQVFTKLAGPTASVIICKTPWRWPGPRPSCCGRRLWRPRAASLPRAMCSTGGTRPWAPGCAPIARTTCSGCPWPACTICAPAATPACCWNSAPFSPACRSPISARTATLALRPANTAPASMSMPRCASITACALEPMACP